MYLFIRGKFSLEDSICYSFHRYYVSFKLTRTINLLYLHQKLENMKTDQVDYHIYRTHEIQLRLSRVNLTDKYNR